MATITIPSRFNGPEGSANGGYTCGLIAGAVGGTVEVTLRTPPPLERPLSVTAIAEGFVVSDGGVLVAQARHCEPWTLDVPPVPSVEEALEASTRYAGADEHEFSRCVVCGPERDDGFRIFAGRLSPGIVASTWTPSADLPGDGTQVGTEIMWAALDCPGAWASARDLNANPAVLGRMKALVFKRAIRGETHIVMGWTVADEGRKSFSGTAIAASDGEVLGISYQTWIVLAR